MGNHFFMVEALLKGKGGGEGGGSKYVTILDLVKLPPPTPPLKKNLKNKLQVICAVHNLGHEEFLICEIRSLCLVS